MSLPLAGLNLTDLHDTFDEGRASGKPHDAIDLMASRSTPVGAVDDGRIVKLFLSRHGGNTVYQFDPEGTYCYYYAHLDRYAEGLSEGSAVHKGQVLGYVGSTGDASPDNPHLHFAITRLGPDKRWWQGTAINPYPVFLYILEQRQ